MKNAASCGELRVTGDALLEAIKDLALGCQVIHLQACSGGDSDLVFLADKTVFAVALSHRDLWVGDVAEFIVDSLDRIEWSQVLFSYFRGSTVGKGPRDDGLFLGYGRVHKEISEIDSHVNGSSAIAVEDIESIENIFELVATPDVIVIVPSVWASGEDVYLEARNNTKVVACTLHTPQKIAIASFVDTNGSAVGQNNIELAEIVANHAVKTFKGSMATPKTGAHHTDAIAGTSGGNIALIPKVI